MNHTPLRIEDILHEYENTRLKNKGIAYARRDEVYERLPRVKELSEGGTLRYLAAARARVGGQDISGENKAAVQKENRQNSAEVRSLLKEAGYPEDYLDPIYDCPLCKDTGYIDDKRCSCFTKKLIDRLYLQSNLTNILDRENFETFDTTYYSKEPAEGLPKSPYENITGVLHDAKAFVRDFKPGGGNGNILIYGETGLGKTFLSNCIAKEILDKGHTVLYLSSNELFERLLGPFLMGKDNSLSELYGLLFDCELLIIDDLGTEFTNDFVRTQFFELINRRILLGRSTLISTNLGLKQLSENYTERVMSRIIADYTVFYLYGDNIRYQKRRNQYA